MTYSSSLRTAILAATIAMLSVHAQAGPMPTKVAPLKSMIHQNTIDVRWGGSWRGEGCGYRGVGFHGGEKDYRGRWGHRGYDHSGSYCSPPLAAKPAIKFRTRHLWNMPNDQNRRLWVAPEDRLPWTD